MQTITLDTPALFADHHVSEVRRILLELHGVQEVYASSAFQAVEVTFDPAATNADAITTTLADAGYLGEIPMLAETGIAVEKKEGNGLFRHTAVYETVKTTVSFAQHVESQSRPLWPCPGMGAVRMKMDE